MNNPPLISTLEYLEKVDHALTMMDTGDDLRLAEIRNLQTPIRRAIMLYSIDAAKDFVDDYAQEVINTLRDRIDALFLNESDAGAHNIFRTK